jgi:hypothetical protein
LPLYSLNLYEKILFWITQVSIFPCWATKLGTIGKCHKKKAGCFYKMFLTTFFVWTLNNACQFYIVSVGSLFLFSAITYSRGTWQMFSINKHFLALVCSHKITNERGLLFIKDDSAFYLIFIRQEPSKCLQRSLKTFLNLQSSFLFFLFDPSHQYCKWLNIHYFNQRSIHFWWRLWLITELSPSDHRHSFW